MKIAVAGTGYVGLSNAIIFAQHNEDVAIDILPEKVELLNSRISPIQDVEISQFLSEKYLNFERLSILMKRIRMLILSL